MFNFYLDYFKPNFEMLILSFLFLLFVLFRGRVLGFFEGSFDKKSFKVIKVKVENFVEPFVISLRPAIFTIIIPVFLVLLFSGVQLYFKGSLENIVKENSLFYLLVVSFFGPIYEELLFRGLFLGKLLFLLLERTSAKKNFLSKKPLVWDWLLLFVIVFFQAILFSVYHPGFRQLQAFFSGLFYGFFYVLYWLLFKQKNLLPSLVMHVSDNLLLTFYLLIF